MKAILRLGTGLLGLFLVAAVSKAQDRIWVSAAFRTPLGQAPSPSNSGGFYYVDCYGRLIGPNWYLAPPFPPAGGLLPGPIGQAIMAGNLPHDLLLNKKAMTVGDAPLLNKKKGRGEPEPPPAPQGPQMPHMAGGGPMPPYPMNPYAGGGPMPPYPMNPYAGGAMPFPMAYAVRPPAPPNTQMPYSMVPPTPYAQQPPYYPQPMMQPVMPYAMPPTAYAPVPPVAYPPGSPYPAMRPVGYIPYYGPPGMYANVRQDPKTGIWLVQNVMPGQGATPFQPIPGFRPPVTATPTMPGAPAFPAAPMTPMNPFGPVQQFSPFTPMQGPQPPQMNWQPMQLPRMDNMQPPRPPQAGGNMFPTHPFTRSPRDFFMWGEMMEDERARGGRPVPVP